MEQSYIAEVIESSTTEFVAQCYELHKSPDFGTFVKVDSPFPVIGMIYDITTGSADLTRRPIAYGKTEEQLRAEQPQIFELLRTEIKVKIVGYAGESGMRQLIPPQPPKLHSFVYECPPEEVQEFTCNFDYFRTLIGLRGTLADELLIAAIQQTCRCQQDNARHCLIRTGKELARLFRDDYDRMESILKRIAL